MDFDSLISERLRGLRASTWYINCAHIEVTAPHAYVLQGLAITPNHPENEPRGVVRLVAPGQYSNLFITAVHAPSVAALATARQRLEVYLAETGIIGILPNQMPVASAATRGAILLPQPDVAPPERRPRRGSATCLSAARKAAV